VEFFEFPRIIDFSQTKTKISFNSVFTDPLIGVLLLVFWLFWNIRKFPTSCLLATLKMSLRFYHGESVLLSIVCCSHMALLSNFPPTQLPASFSSNSHKRCHSHIIQYTVFWGFWSIRSATSNRWRSYVILSRGCKGRWAMRQVAKWAVWEVEVQEAGKQLLVPKWKDSSGITVPYSHHAPFPSPPWPVSKCSKPHLLVFLR
jgi:hypothetical protein